MKCAVDKCNQSTSKKPTCGNYISFYGFPKDATQKNIWVKFCNGIKDINTQTERICALHFKPEDFERNLKYEMGLSNRRTLKLKPGAVPTIDSNVVANEMKETATKEINALFLSDTDKNNPQQKAKLKMKNEESPQQITIPEMNEFRICDGLNPRIKKLEVEIVNEENVQQKDCRVDCLLLQINKLESKMKALRKENELIRSRSANKLKILTRQFQTLNSTNANLEKALRRLFTEGQIKQLKNCDKLQKFTEEDIAQSLTLYTTSPKAYELLKKKNFPLPSVRVLQGWLHRADESRGNSESVVKKDIVRCQANV